MVLELPPSARSGGRSLDSLLRCWRDRITKAGESGEVAQREGRLASFAELAAALLGDSSAGVRPSRVGQPSGKTALDLLTYLFRKPHGGPPKVPLKVPVAVSL